MTTEDPRRPDAAENASGGHTPIELAPIRPAGTSFTAITVAGRAVVHWFWDDCCGDRTVCGETTHGPCLEAGPDVLDALLNGAPGGHPDKKVRLCTRCTPMVWALQLAREASGEETPPDVVFLGGESDAPVIECPHCRAHGTIHEEEATTSGLPIDWARCGGDGGRISGVAGPTPPSEPEHVRFYCGTCRRSVTIPGEVDVSYG